MPRALTVHRCVIPVSGRERQLARLKERGAHYRAAHCRYWVFEESSVSGAFLEFVEADSAEVITRAHAEAIDPPADPGRVYLEVELS